MRRKEVDVFTEGCPASLEEEDRDFGPCGDVAIVGCNVRRPDDSSYRHLAQDPPLKILIEKAEQPSRPT